MQLEIRYVECPNCKKWYSKSELVSYNTFGGAECWSDGKTFNDNMSEYSFLPFTKCDNCKEFFWYENGRQVNDYNVSEYLRENEHIVDSISRLDEKKAEKNEGLKKIVDFLKDNLEAHRDDTVSFQSSYPPPYYWENLAKYFICDFQYLLSEQDKLTPENEVYLRIKLWQHINDLIRNGSAIVQYFKRIRRLTDAFRISLLFKNIKHKKEDNKLYEKHRVLEEENKKKLSHLLQNANIENYIEKNIFIIELERQLGNFEKAKQIMENLDPSEKHYHEAFISKSKKMIVTKSKKVFRM